MDKKATSVKLTSVLVGHIVSPGKAVGGVEVPPQAYSCQAPGLPCNRWNESTCADALVADAAIRCTQAVPPHRQRSSESSCPSECKCRPETVASCDGAPHGIACCHAALQDPHIHGSGSCPHPSGRLGVSCAVEMCEHDNPADASGKQRGATPCENVRLRWIDDSRGRFKWVEIGDARGRDVDDVARDQGEPMHLGRGS